MTAAARFIDSAKIARIANQPLVSLICITRGWISQVASDASQGMRRVRICRSMMASDTFAGVFAGHSFLWFRRSAPPRGVKRLARFVIVFWRRDEFNGRGIFSGLVLAVRNRGGAKEQVG